MCLLFSSPEESWNWSSRTWCVTENTCLRASLCCSGRKTGDEWWEIKLIIHGNDSPYNSLLIHFTYKLRFLCWVTDIWRFQFCLLSAQYFAFTIYSKSQELSLISSISLVTDEKLWNLKVMVLWKLYSRGLQPFFIFIFVSLWELLSNNKTRCKLLLVPLFLNFISQMHTFLPHYRLAINMMFDTACCQAGHYNFPHLSSLLLSLLFLMDLVHSLFISEWYTSFIHSFSTLSSQLSVWEAV